MDTRVEPATLPNYSSAEWQARVELAAAHRLAYMQGFSEGIFNHLTFTVPGCDDRYYQIPFGMHWSEVTASALMEVGDDRRLANPVPPERMLRACDAVLETKPGTIERTE